MRNNTLYKYKNMFTVPVFFVKDQVVFDFFKYGMHISFRKNKESTSMKMPSRYLNGFIIDSAEEKGVVQLV